jgi:hypothetical protein
MNFAPPDGLLALDGNECNLADHWPWDPCTYLMPELGYEYRCVCVFACVRVCACVYADVGMSVPVSVSVPSVVLRVLWGHRGTCWEKTSISKFPP